MKCILTCEHASNEVPSRYAHIFEGENGILATHRAYDSGAEKLARQLGQSCGAAVYCGAISRLLIDLNRSPSNRKSLFSPYSRKLLYQDRELLLQHYYFPYREKVENVVRQAVDQGSPVLHISVHSFASVRNGRVRQADIGLLYDPARNNEKLLCAFLLSLFREKAGSLMVRRNYPYRGNTDGFNTFLRQRLPANLYVGVEIEMNQALPQTGEKYRAAVDVLIDGIGCILQCENFAGVTATEW
jgi:predicted N-formylglutamate amidohydrolase